MLIFASAGQLWLSPATPNEKLIGKKKKSLIVDQKINEQGNGQAFLASKLFAQAEVSELPAARLGMENRRQEWRKVWLCIEAGQPQSLLSSVNGAEVTAQWV